LTGAEIFPFVTGPYRLSDPLRSLFLDQEYKKLFSIPKYIFR